MIGIATINHTFSGKPFWAIALVRKALAALSSRRLTQVIINDIALFIDRSIVVHPLTFHLDVGLIHTPRR